MRMGFTQATDGSRRARRRRATRRWSAGAAATGALLLCQCGDEPTTAPAPPALDDAPTTPVAVEVQLARDLAAAAFDATDHPRARALLAPLVAAADAPGEDLLRAAIVELALGERDSARALLDRAASKSARDPRLWFNRARLARGEERLEEAVGHLKRALELAPSDLFTQLVLAVTLHDLESPEALPALQRILDQGVEHGGSVYVAALYRLSRLHIEAGRMEPANAAMDEFQRLQDQGITAPDGEQVERGSFGVLAPPRPQTLATAAPLPPAAPLAAPSALWHWPGALGVRPITLLDDKALAISRKAAAPPQRAPELLAWGSGGVAVAQRGSEGRFEPVVIDARAASTACALDLDKDGDLDLIAAQGDLLRGFTNERAAFSAAKGIEVALPGAAAQLLPVDYDHDGDLDLLAIGPFGALLLRDDGLAQGGALTLDRDSGVAVEGGCTWGAVEDLDCDQDVDLLVGSAERTWRFDNLRGGRFRRIEGALPAGFDGAAAPLLGDFDQDGRPDLARAGVLGHFRADFALRSAESGAPAAGGALTAWGDLDRDGRLDGFGTREGAALLQLAIGSATPESAAGPTGSAAGTSAAAIVDLDADGGPDLLFAPAGEVAAAFTPVPPSSHRALRLTLIGVKDNRRGIGAVVELRARDVYTRLFWDGEPRVMGLGAHEKADFVRVTWPNGVVQTVTDAAAGSVQVIEQKEGLVGSCPFLYTWNGTRYEFVTDVLGITPLGLPLAPGLLVPPDHDEYVLIRGEQLAPRDGAFDLQLTEELREVTYLDRVRLDVVDHPQGSEIFPNERFTFPPFPEAMTHVVVAPRPPFRALGSDGRDWAAELAALDGELARPFAPYRPAEAGATHSPTWGGQFQGLAPQHTLELEFDRAAVVAAPRLRLVMTGWFFWTDASVNVAAARTPSIRFEPPQLQVPDGAGGWRDAGPPLGFPAGKLKSMVIDVTELLRRDDPRLRLVSTLRLYWDSIRLAVDDGATPFVTTPLEATTAQLWERGFSASQLLGGDQQLEWFDWERLSDEPRWNQHPGSYTRLGDVLPLTQSIDDRFVVMGAGDALHLRFDAAALPPLPAGWRRDYLLFVDGWAKDRDANTVDALHVEPLPFHGMSGYPYRADERFPDGALHRAWRREWQTRPARRWIAPLAPREAFAAGGSAPR